MQGSMLERYARLPIDSPRPIIWVVVLLTLVASPLLLEVEFATDVQAFLPQSEEVETYDKITDQFGRDPSVVNLYITPIGSNNVLTMQNLADLLVLWHGVPATTHTDVLHRSHIPRPGGGLDTTRVDGPPAPPCGVTSGCGAVAR